MIASREAIWYVVLEVLGIKYGFLKFRGKEGFYRVPKFILWESGSKLIISCASVRYTVNRRGLFVFQGNFVF